MPDYGAEKFHCDLFAYETTISIPSPLSGSDLDVARTSHPYIERREDWIHDRMISLSSVVGAVRQPEYVGENRCRPCTLVNLLITAVISGLVAILSVPAAILIATGCVLIIYFRGYLIPGTPSITHRYFPPFLLRIFNQFEEDRTDQSDVLSPEAILEFCLDAGAIELDAEDIPTLTEPFHRAWVDQIERFRELDSQELLTMIFDIESEQLSTEVNNDWFVVYTNGNKLTHWRSFAAFLADVAAYEVLERDVQGWRDFDRLEQSEILRRLRVMLPTCPLCDDPLRIRETAGCCPGETAIVVDCQACNTIILEDPS